MQWAWRQHQTRHKQNLVFATLIVALLLSSLAPLFTGKAAAATKSATWSGQDTIVSGGHTYQSQGTIALPYNNSQTKYQVYQYSDTSNCPQVIYFRASDNLTKIKTAKYQNTKYFVLDGYQGATAHTCKVSGSGSVSLTNTQANPDAAAAPGATDPNGDNGQPAEIDPCDKTADPLTWVVCPVVAMVHGATMAMQVIINHLMNVDVQDIFGNGKSGKAYYASWNSFRIFGIALIVIAGLIMVIGQAIGVELFDAYTVKKVLPRLFIAAIGISLSWWIMKFMVEITDDLGIGIRAVIYYPFRSLGAGITQDWASSLFEILMGVGAYAFLGIGGVLSLFATAGLAALVAFVVLVIRQIVITFLIIIAPLAIACFVLPNTQKAYKLWWESLSKALLMFPIITGFIAAGQVFSLVAAGVDNSYSINKVIALVAYFLPYFALPFTFRLAGGAIGTLGGLVNDRSRGAFDRLKKYRGNRIAENGANMKAGTRFNYRALNSMTARATTQRLGFGKRGQAAYEQKMALATHDFSRSAQGQAIQFNDPALRAMTYGSAWEAKANMARDFDLYKKDGAGNYVLDAAGNKIEQTGEISSAIAAVKANGGFGAARQSWATKQLAATGTGFDDTAQMYATIARSSGGNEELAHSMWGEMRGTSERAGRNDLKAGYGLGASALSQVMGSGKVRTDEVRSEFKNTFTELGIDAARGVDNMSAMRNKPTAIRNMMADLEAGQVHYQEVARTSTNAEDRAKAEVKLGQIRAKMENLADFKSYGPEVNAEMLHGKRTYVTTASDPQGNPAQVRVDRAAGLEESLPYAINAQQDVVGSAPSYREERQARLSREEAERRGMGGADPGGSPTPEE